MPNILKHLTRTDWLQIVGINIALAVVLGAPATMGACGIVGVALALGWLRSIPE